MSFIKKLYVVLLVLFTQSYAFASYYTPDVNKDCTLSSYSKINEFISKCGVNERIANEEVFLDKKFTGKYPTLLYIAVLFNDLKMVKKLVTLGADVNALNYFPESSALMKAVENNNIEMVKYLLDKGADVNQTTPKYYLSAIDFAATYEMALLLLSHNAKVDKINGYTYYTPLQKAILLENNQMIQAYIPKSNIYQKDYLFEKDALYYAVAARNMEAVKMLINAGAKISPAEYQVYKDMVSNEDIIKTLSNIVDKNKKEVKLRENVSAAILYDKIKSSDYKLLNIFTDILEDEEYYALTDPSTNNMTINEYEPYRDTVKSLNFPIYEHKTGFDLRAYHEEEDQKEYDEDFEPYLRYFPMTAAVTYDDVELFKAMLDANHLKMQYPVKYHTNLFAIAVFNHNIEIVKLLMKYNYSPIPCAPPLYNNEGNGYFTLEYSCSNLLADVISNFEDIDVESEELNYYKKLYDMFIDYEQNIYSYPLDEFIRSETDDIDLSEEELLEIVQSKPVGVLSYTNDAAQGLLHIALKKGYDKLASYLIINGFDIYDNYGFVPLEFASDNKYIQQLLIMGENMYLGSMPFTTVFNNAGDTEKLKLFIKYGLDVNVRNQFGKPVLFEAVEKQSLDSVKLLVENGANLDDLYKGANILQYAEKLGTKEIAAYIKGELQKANIALKDDALFNYIMDKYDECKYRNFYSGYQESKHINDIIRSFRYYEKNKCEKSSFEEKYTPDEVTPLLYAVIIDDENIVKLLLEKGADPSLTADEDTNAAPLTTAVKTRNDKIIKIFLERNVTLSKKHLTSLFMFRSNEVLDKYNMISQDDVPLVQISACAKDSKYLATALKNIDISRITKWNIDTSKYFDASKRSKYKPNPLECAVSNNLADNVKLLLNSKIYVKDDSGFNALTYAKEKNADSKIIDMIEKYCKKNKDKC